MKQAIFAAALTALMIPAAVSQAATLSESHVLAAGGDGSVAYTAFTVTTAGYFDIYTQAPGVDAVLYLFKDGNSDGVLGKKAEDPLVRKNDDGCKTSLPFCNSGSGRDALIDDILLDVGTYILAVGDYPLDEDEVRKGINKTTDSSPLTINISTDYLATGKSAGVAVMQLQSSAVETSLPAVPIPASLPLLLTALGGLISLRSWRTKNRNNA